MKVKIPVKIYQRNTKHQSSGVAIIPQQSCLERKKNARTSILISDKIYQDKKVNSLRIFNSCKIASKHIIKIKEPQEEIYKCNIFIWRFQFILII